jgi:hypothetical protein
MDLARVVRDVGVERADLGRRHAARARGAVPGRGALRGEIAEQGRSNIDIEKHLRRVELKIAQANAWLAMARELAWQRDDYGGRAAR